MADQSEDHNGLDSPKKSNPDELRSTEKLRSSDELRSTERTPDYKFLIEYGLDTKVAGRLDDIYKTGSNLLYFI